MITCRFRSKVLLVIFLDCSLASRLFCYHSDKDFNSTAFIPLDALPAGLSFQRDELFLLAFSDFFQAILFLLSYHFQSNR